MRICVLGAGIVGLAAAWQLQREGHEVTVVDAGAVGSGASGANGAQLSYAYVQPLADPGIWRQLPSLLLASESPLRLRLRWDVHQWSWALRFLAACNAGASARTTVELLWLAAQSRTLFQHFMMTEQPECDFSAHGKLVLHASASSFAAARRQLALQQTQGVEQWAATPHECRSIEPALLAWQPAFVGGIYTPGECAVDCQALCSRLADLLRARGASLLLGTRVHDLEVRGETAMAARTQAGAIEADAFVVALGVDSHELGRHLGMRLPIYPLKGYSLTLPAGDGAPRVSITDAQRKLVFARIGQRLRVAGMAELGGAQTDIPAARVKSLLDATRERFPRASDVGEVYPWAGMRPATPSGLPILGPQRGAPRNVLFNTGHGALGLTLAFGSAMRIATLVRPRPAFSPVAARPASCSA